MIMKVRKSIGAFILVAITSLLFVVAYWHFSISHFLSFSDGAKFAIVARNLVEGRGFGSDFTFYSSSLLTSNLSGLFGAGGVPYLVPFTLSVFFKVFGISDLSVILFSGTFYFLLVLTVFLLARKLYGNLAGFLSAIAVAANKDFLNYATSGASETLYTFLAAISAYLIFVENKWTNILFFISLAALYLTKPQGIVFILALLFTWLIKHFSWKKGIAVFVGLVAGLFLLDKLILYPLSFKYPVYPIVTRGIQAIFQYSPTTAVSDALRGGTTGAVGFKQVLVKSFYNLYNFYKLLPEIASPYLWGLFFIGLFVWGKNKEGNIFKILTTLLVIGSFLLAALTIPFYRYLHPVVPFVYIVAVGTLVTIFNSQFSVFNKFSILNFQFSKRILVILASLSLILLFGVGQTLGIIFLDSRFEANTHNVGRPPVYVLLSETLKENTSPGQVVVTNLDTWGSWYGERKTVWFPLEPKQLIDPSTGKIPFDGIYLTSYLMNDQNYYMGGPWRSIFNNPEDSKKWTCDGCTEISKEFTLKGVYKISADSDYERQDATAILLIKK